MRLYLDDIRPTPLGYDTRAYTAEEAIDFLKTGLVTEISFDHDLGPSEAGTGYDVAAWIEEQCHTTEFKCPDWHIHSANPVGGANIQAAMESAWAVGGNGD